MRPIRSISAVLALALLLAAGCLEQDIPPGEFDLLAPADGATGVSTRPMLTWSDSAGAETYSLWLSTEEGLFGDEQLLVDDANRATGLELTEDLERGRTYHWRVETRSLTGSTSCRTDFSFTTIHYPPGAFKLLSPAAEAADVPLRPTFEWEEALGATRYTLVVSENADLSAPRIEADGLGVNTFEAVEFLDQATTYHWRVTAHNDGGPTDNSSSFTTIQYPPEAFELLSPAAGATDIVLRPTLTWGDSANAVTYTLWLRAGNSDFTGLDRIVVEQPWVTRFSIPSILHNDTTYYWRILAHNAGGNTQCVGDGSFTTGGAAWVSAGGMHTFTLLPNGTLWGWGANAWGQLGDGTNVDRHTPVQVKGPGGNGLITGIFAISVGGAFTIALKSDGTVWSWGLNGFGQLGDGTEVSRNVPARVRGGASGLWLTDVKAISAGSDHALALKNDGSVWAWGTNYGGQLGNNVGYKTSIPVRVRGGDTGSEWLTGVEAIATGFYSSYALRNDGSVWAWGSNSYGKIGDGTTEGRYAPVQVRGGATGSEWLADIQAISSGGDHVIALRTDGTVWAWGSNLQGSLGDGSFNNSRTPVQVTGGDTGLEWLVGVRRISAGGSHNLVMREDGLLWGWGRNGFGEIGDGTSGSGANRAWPVRTRGLGGSSWLEGVREFSAGGLHSTALEADGIVLSWGLNSFGRLGDGTTTNSSTPVEVAW